MFMGTSLLYLAHVQIFILTPDNGYFAHVGVHHEREAHSAMWQSVLLAFDHLACKVAIDRDDRATLTARKITISFVEVVGVRQTCPGFHLCVLVLRGHCIASSR